MTAVIATSPSSLPSNSRLYAKLSVLRPFNVASVIGLNDDPNADCDMRWNHYPSAVGESRRLIGRRGGLAFHRWFGFRDFQRDAGRQLNSDRGRVEYRQNDLHTLLKPLGLIPDHLRRNWNLVVGASIHEMVAIGVCIKEVKILVLDECPLHLLCRLVSICNLDPIGKAAHVDLSCWSSFTRVKAFRRKNYTQLAVFSFNNIAFAD